MARRTNKVGSSGRFGTRYGVTVRYRERSIHDLMKPRTACTRCQHKSVSRKKSGIWFCKRCSYTFAAGAYTPQVRIVTQEG